MSNLSLSILSYAAARDALTVSASDWTALGLSGVRAHPGELLAKSLQDRGFTHPAPFAFPFEGDLHKAVGEKSSAETEPKGKVSIGAKAKSGGSSSGNGFRWITIHPHGEEHGVPIRIKENRDGSWSVAGGAGGKLNGLRLTHVKSPEEYKQAASEKAKERREKSAEEKQKNFDALKDKHRDAVIKEAADNGHDTSNPDAFEGEVVKRAAAERKEKEGLRAGSEDEVKGVQREQERALIEHVAQSQGWDTGEYNITDQALEKLKNQRKAEILGDNPDLKAKLNSGDSRVAASAAKALEASADKTLQKVIDKQHQLALKRAREVLDNTKELVITATDDISKESMGDVAAGDLIKQTLADAGKGYATNMAEEAVSRGMDIKALGNEAYDQNRQSRVERKDGDVGKADLAEAFIEKLQAGAAMARADVNDAVKALGTVGEGPLGKIASLDTLPKVQDVKGAVDMLAKAKQLEAQIGQTKAALKDVKGGDELDTLPKAAVVIASKEMTHEEAVAEVLHDLDERERQRAMGSLIDAYNAQDAISPIQSHRLSGHSAFLGEVAHAASLNGVGVRSPDPLQADILGAAGSAAVLRRAMELAAGDDKGKVKAVKDALSAHHVETQVALADDAVSQSNELLNQADNLEAFDVDSLDGLMAGLDQEKQRNGIVKEAREKLGVALGRLEAGAALNEALMGKSGKGDLQIPLGAMGMQDALVRAGAAGLIHADQFDGEGGLVSEGHFHIFNDGKNKILVVHPSGIDHLASQLQEDPKHLERLKLVADIKAGKHDEANWLPQGFSRRPATDVSGGDGLAMARHDLQLDLNGVDDAKGIGESLKSHIAARIEAGEDPVSIVSGLRSQLFQAEQVPEEKRGAYNEALDKVVPQLRESGDAATSGQARLEHQQKLRAMFENYHNDWVRGEVKAGRMSSAQASVHNQVLPQDWKTHDLVHQVALQDPRLMHAFFDVGALGPEARKAVREYAFEHLFRDHEGKPIDPKDRETPTQSLSPDERKAYDGWNELGRNGQGDAYGAIQSHLREHSADAGGGGMFGDSAPSEPHAFSTVDLNDDGAVVAAAKANADKLGYSYRREVGSDDRHYDELTEREGHSLKDIARGARQRIQGELRAHAYEHMMGVPKLAQSGFDPTRVQTGSARWAQYVAGMGGGDSESEKRAYQTIQEKMKGDFAARFVKGRQQLNGTPFQTVAAPLTYGDAHSMAVLAPDRRKEVQAQNASERAKMQNRQGGQFGQDNTGAKLDAQRQGALMDAALFGSEDAKTEGQQLDTHRLSLGAAAEGMVRGMMPNIKLKKGTVAAGDIDMSTGVGVKRQRAIKQLEATGRLGLTLGVGCVHESTIIEDAVSGESHTIREWMLQERAPRVWALDKGAQVVSARASVPFMKAYATMFQVGTESGHQVTVTASHRFLTSCGWAPLRDIHVGDGIAVGNDGELRFDRVASLTCIGGAFVYDITVPEYENYLGQGIWHHNTGKTAISLGAFSHLKAQGKAKRAIMAVPSVVQEQFGSEAARFYDLTDPKHPTWSADSKLSPDARRASYHKDSGNDIVVVTHQALRDDLTWALGQHKYGGNTEAAAKFLEEAPESERNEAMKAAMAHHGWDFDMSAVDEGHGLLNRAGKQNSAMANAIDAFTHDKKFHASMSADPVKNDASEAWDFLRKIAPGRYVNDGHELAGTPGTVSRAEFLRKYNVNTPAASEALQNEMAPYHYAESITPESELSQGFHTIPMTAPQTASYNQVNTMYNRARGARKRGGVDVEAVKHLSPNSFAEVPVGEHENHARRLAGSLGILRDSALDRVVNQHPQGAKLEWLDERLGLKPKSGKYGDFDTKPPGEHCPIVFAHNLGSIDLLEAHLKAQGLRVGRLDGTMTGEEKEKAKTGFSPQFDKSSGKYVSDPTADVMLCSDAGAVGWNGQRSQHVVHFDTPLTSMVHEQRTGRSYRTGQEHNVHSDTVLTDTGYERTRRKRLERKAAMRQALTSPAEMLDDSGLSARIAAQADSARSQAVYKAAPQS